MVKKPAIIIPQDFYRYYSFTSLMYKFTIITLVFLAISFGSKAQKSPSSDELFTNARHAAFEDKNYEKAKQLAFEALKKSPDYADIDIFLGRVYSWNHLHDLFPKCSLQKNVQPGHPHSKRHRLNRI